MSLRDVPRPSPAPGEVLLQVIYSGICGSELSGFMGKSSIRTPPLVFGHEIAGLVAKVGAGTDCAAPVGARATVYPLVVCGSCQHCVTTRSHLCRTRRLLGAALPGGNAEYVLIPAASVEPIPDTLTLRDASMAEPAACAIHAVSLSAVTPADSALVVGAGPIGLFVIQVLRVYGVVDIYVADPNPDRLRMAAASGATPIAHGAEGLRIDIDRLTGGAGVAVSFDAAGTVQTRVNCAAATAAGGKVMLIGLHAEETSLPINMLIRNEMAVHGVFAYTPAEFRTAVTWLADGRIGLRDGVVDTDLAEGPLWYQRLVDGDPTAKVLLRPNALLGDGAVRHPA
jgi:threonine dehydrogenase-like Zn-dependent dehydrogenase